MIDFILNFEPDVPTMTHQQGLRAGVTKDGKPFLYKDRKYQDIEAAYDAKLVKFAPPSPIEGPVYLQTMWMFAGKKTEYRMKKPDTDNLVKLLKDRMTRIGFWKDDAQVVKEFVVKLNLGPEEKHGVHVKIEEL